jgi:hypothetical protein
MSSSSLTAKTKHLIEGMGGHIELVEVYNIYARKKKDLFGFADHIAILDEAVILIQTTSAAHRAERRKKIQASELAARWLATNNEIWLITWAKRARPNKAGRPQIQWTPTIESLRESLKVSSKFGNQSKPIPTVFLAH